MGELVAWIQAGIWVIATISFLLRQRKSEGRMHRLVSSPKFLAAVILLGISTSAWSLYLTYSARFVGVPEKELELVSKRQFINQEVEVDGKNFDECRFINVKLVFRGRKVFALNHNNFEGTVSIHGEGGGLKQMGQLVVLLQQEAGLVDQARVLVDTDGDIFFMPPAH